MVSQKVLDELQAAQEEREREEDDRENPIHCPDCKAQLEIEVDGVLVAHSKVKLVFKKHSV